MTEDAPLTATFRYEMGFAPAEFHRLLPGVADVAFDSALNRFVHAEADRSWTLTLIDPRARAFGGLRLPVVDVELVFRGYTPAEAREIVDRFLTHFRRGGG